MSTKKNTQQKEWARWHKEWKCWPLRRKLEYAIADHGAALAHPCIAQGKALWTFRYGLPTRYCDLNAATFIMASVSRVVGMQFQLIECIHSEGATPGHAQYSVSLRRLRKTIMKEPKAKVVKAVAAWLNNQWSSVLEKHLDLVTEADRERARRGFFEGFARGLIAFQRGKAPAWMDSGREVWVRANTQQNEETHNGNDEAKRRRAAA